VTVRGGDPRLHVFETVVRKTVIDAPGEPSATIHGVRTANLLPEQR